MCYMRLSQIAKLLDQISQIYSEFVKIDGKWPFTDSKYRTRKKEGQGGRRDEEEGGTRRKEGRGVRRDAEKGATWRKER